MDAKGQAGKLNLSDGIPRNATVLAARWSWVYEDGTEAGPTNDVYLHHLISSDVTKLKANPFSGCNAFDELVGRQFNNRGQDSGEKETLYMVQNSSLVSGYHLGALPIIRVQYDLINYSRQTKNVYLQLTLEYLRGRRGLDTGTVLESVGGIHRLPHSSGQLTDGRAGCENDVPLNVNGTTTGRVINVSEDATIVWACGHMHPGGSQVNMEINGRLACGSSAIYDEKHTLSSMTLCPVPIEIKEGDKIVLTSTYDTKAHPMRKSTEAGGHEAHLVGGGHDVMGMMGIVYTVKGRR
jgi:hypothetical protein